MSLGQENFQVELGSKPREYSDEALERMSEEEHNRKIEEDIASRFFEGEFQLL